MGVIEGCREAERVWEWWRRWWRKRNQGIAIEEQPGVSRCSPLFGRKIEFRLCAVWSRRDVTKVANDVSGREVLPEPPGVELSFTSCNDVRGEDVARDEDAEDRSTSPESCRREIVGSSGYTCVMWWFSNGGCG